MTDSGRPTSQATVTAQVFLRSVSGRSIRELAGMARHPARGTSLLVELKAVDAAWPLYGRVATRRSEFAFPEVRLGMIPGSGGTQRALRLMGMTRAKLFMMTGRRISAEQAEAWGLITQAVADDKLDEAVQALATELAERAALALRTLKLVLNRGADAPLDTALELERKAYAWLRSTHDYGEGVTAFLEKRPPRYTGR